MNVSGNRITIKGCLYRDTKEDCKTLQEEEKKFQDRSFKNPPSARLRDAVFPP